MLEFMEIEEPYTGKNMAEIVVSLLEELDISKKLITITSNNADNNDTLADNVLYSLQNIYSDTQESTAPLQFDG